MLSWRLWRSITNVDFKDPVFRRVSHVSDPGPPAQRRFRPPRWLLPLTTLALAIAIINAPQWLILLLIVPMLLVTLLVAAPILLPLAVLLAGLPLTANVISGILREKHQYTYDLLCASTRGTLDASWAFASGILYRSRWFLHLRWGTRLSLRAGLAALGGLSIFALYSSITSGPAFGFEQARLLLLTALLLALYASNLTQTLVLSLLVGLVASSFDHARQDSTLIGIVAYLTLAVLPLLAGASVLVACGRILIEPGPAALMLLETAALLLVVGLREAAIVLLWSALRRRLDWGRGTASRGELVERDAAWSVS